MAKATIRDVAKQAGVSIATVSHVINNTRFVSEDTRQKVMDSIAALQYSPDAVARIFKTGRKNLIGFIVPDIANDFFATIIEEIEAGIDAQNYKLIVANTKETKAREMDDIRVFTSGIVDGMIIASTMNRFDEIETLVPSGFPLVFVDRALPGCNRDSITVSNYSALCEGMEALIREGHRRIGYITGLFHLSTSQERLKAYRDTMNAYDLPVEESLICLGDSMSKSPAVHVDKLLAAGCTALVVSNNVMTMDVYYYLREKNIPIGRPEGIALLGYNDNYQSGHRMPASIHTICQPAHSLGRLAGEQMLARIAQPKLPIREILLQATFMPRQVP